MSWFVVHGPPWGGNAVRCARCERSQLRRIQGNVAPLEPQEARWQRAWSRSRGGVGGSRRRRRSGSVSAADEPGKLNSEACRTVGINRSTGSRWRFGRTVERSDGHQLYYAPIATPVVLSGQFLSAQERLVIADGVRAGVTALDRRGAEAKPVDDQSGGGQEA